MGISFNKYCCTVLATARHWQSQWHSAVLLRALHRSQHGSISILSVFAVMLLTMLLGMVMNVGRQVDGKVRMQNAADAVAYSGGVVMARGMNTLAFTNQLLCEIFALTAVLREAQSRDAEPYVPQILAAWKKEGPVFERSNFPKFTALGAAITKKVPLEQELVRAYSEWAAAVSKDVLPLYDYILSHELIPQYQRAVVAAFPDIAQAAAVEVARRNGQPDFGRGDMRGALWQTSVQPVGGGNVLPVAFAGDSQYDTNSQRYFRDLKADDYRKEWNNQTLAFFDRYGKMSQFANMWRSFTYAYLESIKRENADRNLPCAIRIETPSQAELEQSFTFVGVVYWKKVPELAPKVFSNPIESDAVAFAEVQVFVPTPRLLWWTPPDDPSSSMKIGGVPGNFLTLPDDNPPPPPDHSRIVREGVRFDWSLWNQHWTCQLVPATTTSLAAILQTPAFAGQSFVLPQLGNLSAEDIGRISTH